jgi:hypothetical protein
MTRSSFNEPALEFSIKKISRDHHNQLNVFGGGDWDGQQSEREKKSCHDVDENVTTVPG